jgi:DNA-binding IscR family transcriptional regulator
MRDPNAHGGRLPRENEVVRVSAKADYAIRAAIELAAAGDDGPVKGERIAQAQEIPFKFLENILGMLDA